VIAAHLDGHELRPHPVSESKEHCYGQVSSPVLWDAAHAGKSGRSPADVGASWQVGGCERAFACGVTADLVINALPADDLLAWISARR
jgi:hypothetical protein